MTRGQTRWAIYVHHPEGDMGDGVVLGAFRTADAAEKDAGRIRRADDAVECIVVPLWPGGSSAADVVQEVSP